MQGPMTCVVNIEDLLDEHGDPVPAIRRKALRFARLVEYGGPLEVGQARETLVECSRRPDRRPCPGLLWVQKRDPQAIEATCLICRDEHIVITGWESTIWADGPMEPID